jgi:hypothetical protein
MGAFCSNCHLPMPPGKRADAIYCSDRCRWEAHNGGPPKRAPRPRRADVTITEPTPQTLAYLAGIVDGEGHFATPKSGHGIVCCMADIPILEWCHAHFSGSLSGRYVPNGNNRPRRIWQVTRQADLQYLLPLLAPLLVLKRRECELMIVLNDLHLNRPHRHLDADFIRERDRLRMEIRAAIAARKR